MTRLEVRNLRPALIAGYLRDELGGTGDDTAVHGEGWRVGLVAGEPAGVGRYHVPVLFLDVEGAREAEVTAFLRQKTMRGGG